MMFKEILAKSNPQETLPEHVSKVYNIWKQLEGKYKRDIPDDNFWHFSLISVVFHDFGKITNNFQDVIQGKVKNFDNYIRHEFISGMFLAANNYKYYKSCPSSLFAVLSHHKPLNLDLFSKETTAELNIVSQLIQDFLLWVNKELFEKENIKYTVSDISINYLKNSYQQFFNDYKNRILPFLNDLDSSARNTYINYKAILQISDWLASGNNSLPVNLLFDTKYLKTRLLFKLNKERKKKGQELFDRIELREFQKKSDIQGNVIAVAPTGSGKTEAALIWAKNKKDSAKIIYLLPTKVTSIAIYHRLKSYFGEKHTAVVHSSAFYFRKELDDSYDKKDYLLDKTFFRNVNVSTVDQILTQGFNLGYWELKTFHQKNAKVIIDEIHLYEPYTLGLIMSTIKYLQENFNATFYIMTATLPNTLKRLLQKYLSNTTLIEDRELLGQARNVFIVRNQFIEESVEEIIENAKKGKKVLVVVNTVDSAISLYKTIKEKIDADGINILCYHSRFTILHRQEKEKTIFEIEASEEPGILIATQVVEVSLDIDFDILFTENAPIDAIIQRAGRVNRKRKKSGTKVLVLKHSEISEKWVYNINDVLNKTWKVLEQNNNEQLTEETLISLVENVYSDFDIEENEEFKKGLSIYSEEQRRLSYIMDNQANENNMTRLNMDTINVIPMINHTSGEDYQILLADKQSFEIAKYELSIRKNKEYKFRIEQWNHYKFIDAYYDEEIGMDFKKKENETEFI